MTSQNTPPSGRGPSDPIGRARVPTPRTSTPTPSAGGRRPTPGQPATGAVAELVREFYETKAEELQKQKEMARRKRRVWLLPLMLLLALAAWLSPLFVPSGPETLSIDTIEEGTKVSMYLAGMEIAAFRRANGRLPSSIGEAGVDLQGVQYSRLTDSTFELRTILNEQPIVYRSMMSRDAFLGPAASVLERR